MTKLKDKPKEEKPKQEHCPKCKKDVDARDYNKFFNICNNCLDNSSGRGK